MNEFQFGIWNIRKAKRADLMFVSNVIKFTYTYIIHHWIILLFQKFKKHLINKHLQVGMKPWVMKLKLGLGLKPSQRHLRKSPVVRAFWCYRYLYSLFILLFALLLQLDCSADIKVFYKIFIRIWIYFCRKDLTLLCSDLFNTNAAILKCLLQCLQTDHDL